MIINRCPGFIQLNHVCDNRSLVVGMNARVIYGIHCQMSLFLFFYSLLLLSFIHEWLDVFMWLQIYEAINRVIISPLMPEEMATICKRHFQMHYCEKNCQLIQYSLNFFLRCSVSNKSLLKNLSRLTTKDRSQFCMSALVLWLGNEEQ